MSDLKPIEIDVIDFPNSSETTGSVSTGDSTLDNLKPETSSGFKFPQATIARTVIADSINTQTKRILGEFKFDKSGAIKIGDNTNGEGEIKISPNGIVAKNSAGVDTFTLDGTTGDATFKGTLAAGALIAGNGVYVDKDGIVINDGTSDVVWLNKTGLTINGGKVTIKDDSGVTTLDSKGVVSTANFFSGGTTASSLNQIIGSGSTDITGSSFTISPIRSTTYMFIATANCSITESAGNTGNGYVYIDIDGVEYYVNRTIWASGQNAITGGACFVLYNSLSAGSHTIKLVGHHDILTGSTSRLVVYSFNLAYFKLGN